MPLSDRDSGEGFRHRYEAICNTRFNIMSKSMESGGGPTSTHTEMTATAWAILLVAGLFEAAWAIGLAYSDGFTNLRASVATVVALAISMVLLAKAIQELPVGTAYAVWTGIGAALTALLGIYLFDESARPLRLLFLGVIVVGIAGLHATST